VPQSELLRFLAQVKADPALRQVMADALTADEVSLLAQERGFLVSGSDTSCASTASRLLGSASAVSITLANIPAATTERALARNLLIQNKTPRVGPGGRRVLTRWSVEWACEAADVGTWGHALQVWGGWSS